MMEIISCIGLVAFNLAVSVAVGWTLYVIYNQLTDGEF